MPVKFSEVILYSTEELSEILGLGLNTLRIYFRKGKLKGRKIGIKWYLSEDELRKYLKLNKSNNKKENK